VIAVSAYLVALAVVIFVAGFGLMWLVDQLLDALSDMDARRRARKVKR